MGFLRFVAPLALVASVVALPQRAHASGEEAVIHFGAGAWAPVVEGTLASGATLRIDYDAARLPQCRQLNRNTAWEVVMHYRFDGGPVASLVVADPGMALARDRIAVPAGATSLTLWFENFAASNGGRDIVCQAWDSVYGQNYTFVLP